MTSTVSNAFAVLDALSRLAAGEATSASAPSSQPASAAASPQPATDLSAASPLVMGVAAVGLCVLAAYVVYRWARPGKLKLSPVPRRANRIHPAHVLLLFGANIAVQSCLFRFLLPPLVGEDKGRLMILTTFCSMVLWLPVVLLAGRITFARGLVRGMGLSARHWFIDGLRGFVAYLAVFPVCFLLAWAAMLFPGGTEHPLLTASRGIGWGWQLLSLLSAVVLVPLAEEAFFRGMLQSMLRNYWTSPWPAVVLTSVLFAGVHVNLQTGENWQWVPALTALGLVLGYNYERTGRLLAPILIHALFNGVSMVSLFLYGF
jgi:membrane protease YdiL (CAAX protease family)